MAVAAGRDSIGYSPSPPTKEHNRQEQRNRQCKVDVEMADTVD
jgi:hypothetical protein